LANFDNNHGWVVTQFAGLELPVWILVSKTKPKYVWFLQTVQELGPEFIFSKNQTGN
jgi:hypothetical protein